MNHQPVRILFMGMNGIFSLIPFRRLLAEGLNVVGLVIPSASGLSHAPRPVQMGTPRRPLHLLTPHDSSLLQLAAERGLPVWEAGALSDQRAVGLLKSLRVDLICVACFPRLLPPAWLEAPAFGCLNLHPSLLPAYRGPAPLFWQFRAGEKKTGITLHFMDETADTGDIVARQEVPFPEGIAGTEANRLAAQAGANLLAEALRHPRHIPRSPQRVQGASYQPWPSPADRIISTSWSARRAFNFIRGAGGWGPFPVEVSGERFLIHQALEVQNEPLGELFLPGGNGEAWIRFSPGALRVAGERKSITK